MADDEPALLELVATILREAGFQVTEATDGTEAIRSLSATRFDVVVTDFNMPGADGLSVLAAARAGQPWAKVVVMTGDEAVRERALAGGATAFVTKAGEEFRRRLGEAVR